MSSLWGRNRCRPEFSSRADHGDTTAPADAAPYFTTRYRLFIAIRSIDQSDIDMTARQRNGPLDGLRVIDCSGMIGGGFATAQFADFGAGVVMVEHPQQGDPIREWPLFDDEATETSLW